MAIIHEMGHYVSFDSYSLSAMGYDFAETHSQGNEWLFLAYLKNNMLRKTYNITKTMQAANDFSAILVSTLVDEFEYRVYTAETPYVAGEFRGVMQEVLAFFGIVGEDKLKSYYDEYTQIVTISSPVYYLNYATSGIASMSFFAIAEQQGYEVAQEVYRALQEDCDIYKPYGQILNDIGLSSPFEEQTFIDLGITILD
jgi:oligoendopeptidase F